MAEPILAELKETAPVVLLGICCMAVVYQVVEGLITTVLAKQYEPSFTCGMGITNAFFCSFYRVATLGSGSGVAALFYLKEHGIEYSKGFGLYMLQYAFHKISIALFSIITFVAGWSYMCMHFGDYMELLIAGYALTFVITGFLILFCCSTGFHKFLFLILDFLNGKRKGRFHAMIGELREQCDMLETASKFLLKKKALVAGVIVLNLLKLCFWYAMPYLVFAKQNQVTLLEVMAITSLSVMLAAVIPSPAGIGSTELVFTSLFAGIVGTGIAGSASLLYRFGTFVFPFLIGAVVVIVRRLRAKRVSFVNG